MLIKYKGKGIKTAQTEDGVVYTFNKVVETKNGGSKVVSKPADVKDKKLATHLLEKCNGRFVKAGSDEESPEEEVKSEQPEEPEESEEPGEEEHVCPECGKVCKSKSGLLSHIRTHEK